MSSVTSSSGARRLLATSIVARLPPEMLSVGLLVHARQLTGSFAQAGLVTGVYAVAVGVGGPQLGKLVDRHGQTIVLLISAGLGTALLLTMATLPPHVSVAALSALAAGVGLATPPVGACLRTLLPALSADPEAVRQLYGLEAALVELTYITGPPVALCIGGLWSSAAALGVSGLILLAATAAFAAQPASRRWSPPRLPAPSRRRSLATPAMRTLMIILAAVGLLLGAGEVAVVAAAQAHHQATADAPLFAVWGAGSFCGGLLIARFDGGAPAAGGLMLLLGALTVGHLAVIPVSGSLPGIGIVLFFAGAAIAPTEASLYAMVERAVPSGTMTEAFAWLATAMAVGSAVGAVTAGVVADWAGPMAAFALAGGAGALALLIAIVRSRTITPPRAVPDLMSSTTPQAVPLPPPSRLAPRPTGSRPSARPLPRRGGPRNRRPEDRPGSTSSAAGRHHGGVRNLPDMTDSDDPTRGELE